MASFLLSECLEEVFLYLFEIPLSNTRKYTSTKNLRSCTLVSRHWCRISTPFLYAYPFHHFRHIIYPNDSYFKLIRTLLSCIPKSEIEQIISLKPSNMQKLLHQLFHFNKSNKRRDEDDQNLTTFNYIGLIRGLVFNEKLSEPLLFYYRKTWLPLYIPNNDNTTEDQFSKISIPIMNHLLKYLCKHCNKLKTLEFPFTVQNNEFFNNSIELLTYEDCNVKSKLCDLKELYYLNRKNVANEVILLSKDLYATLSSYICNLNLLYNEGIGNANSLSQFISSQKNLQHIILSEHKYGPMYYNIDHYNIVFDSLSTQSESLQILEFKHLSFAKIDDKTLKSLCLLKNIKELRLYECKGLNDYLQPWAESLTKLEVFEFVTKYYKIISDEFLIQLIQSSSSSLTKFVINYKRSNDQLFKQIPLYLSSLIHLDLPMIYPNELISILKSCTRLVYLGAILSDGGSWETGFKDLGEYIPKNLQKIRFREFDCYIFSIDALRGFFNGLCEERKLKYLEMKGRFILNQPYFDVANEFGVQLIQKNQWRFYY